MSKIIIDPEHPLHDTFAGSGILYTGERNADALRIGFVNLMPNPADPVRDFAKLFAQQDEHAVKILDFSPTPDLITTDSDRLTYRNEHQLPLSELAFHNLDAIVLTGFGKEDLRFEDLKFWPEVREALDVAKAENLPVLASCWGSHAALYHHYGVEKTWDMTHKISGVFRQLNTAPDHPITRGIGEDLTMPVSRYGRSDDSAIEDHADLDVLARSPETGVSVVSDGRILFLTGHPEYPAEALADEFRRDAKQGVAHLNVPENVFVNDDPSADVLPSSWKDAAAKLAINWLNSVATAKRTNTPSGQTLRHSEQASGAEPATEYRL